MAGMAAKMILGNKLNSVKGELGNLGGDGEGNDKDEEEAALIEEARRQQEEDRKARHAKMEAEREVERERIRNKYGLKKKVAEEPMMPEPDDAGRITRKKKTPAEMQQALQQQEEEEEGFLETVKGYVAPFAEKLGLDLFK
ncbi:putative complexin-1 isoform X1 [Diadema antillarum]|uniref:putative complexin-1 isoform X1 n=1 Tax=Diadema antillarum TaxID=105358 RepID=UPI003A88670E